MKKILLLVMLSYSLAMYGQSRCDSSGLTLRFVEVNCQGNARAGEEWMIIDVLGTGTFDLKGYIVDDNNAAASGVGTADGHVRFGTSFSSVAGGTRLFLYDGVVPPSYVAGGNNRLVHISEMVAYPSCPNVSYNGYDCSPSSSSTSWLSLLALRNAGDIAQLRSPLGEQLDIWSCGSIHYNYGREKEVSIKTNVYEPEPIEYNYIPSYNSPTSSFGVTGDYQICVGERFQLVAYGGIAYTWYKNGNFFSSSPVISDTPSVSTLYSVEITLPQGCTVTEPIIMSVRPAGSCRENTYAACHDMLDNDGDGDIDSLDSDCAVFLPCQQMQVDITPVYDCDLERFDVKGLVTGASLPVELRVPQLFLTLSVVDSFTIPVDQINQYLFQFTDSAGCKADIVVDLSIYPTNCNPNDTCLTNLVVDNTSLLLREDIVHLRASDFIKSSAKIKSSNAITFDAGEGISLGEGFEIPESSAFEALLQGCEPEGDINSCSDGIDNDLDNLIDCDDPSCGPPMISSFNVTDVTSCQTPNGGALIVLATGTNLSYSIDSGVTYVSTAQFTGLLGGDYHVMVRNDSTGCTALSIATIAMPNCAETTQAACTDGLDNDGDGLIDCADPNCSLFMDTDNDGVCDLVDSCPNFDNSLIGTSCDDGDSCTVNDLYLQNCNCAGTYVDQDSDGYCVGQDPDDLNPCIPDTSNTNCNQNCGELDRNDFESGLGIWTSGGDDAQRYRSTLYTNSGSYVARLRDNSDAASSIFSDTLSLQDKTSLEISFSFIMNSMESGERLLLELSTDDGSSYSQLAAWTVGDNATNGTRYNISHIVSGRPLTNASRVRFRCDASSNSDYVYIDDIILTACDNGGAQCPLAGQSCNDGDNCTINDTYDAQCICVGTLVDADQDGYCISDDPDDSNPCVPNNMRPDCQSSCMELSFDDIETGLGVWNEGGDDGARYNSSLYANSGSYVVRLRDDSGVNSSVFTDPLDLSAHNSATISFSFLAKSMENTESFHLEVSTDNGGSYATSQTWVSGSDFVNNTRYTVSSRVSGYSFSSQTIFRFRCDASSNSDYVYIDDIRIEGCQDTSTVCNTAGQSCDDGNPCTINDTYDALCNCTGTYMPSACVENTLAACTDGIDNDGDGLIDCLDGECKDFNNCDQVLCSTVPAVFIRLLGESCIGLGEMAIRTQDSVLFSIDGGSTFTSDSIFYLAAGDYELLVKWDVDSVDCMSSLGVYTISDDRTEPSWSHRAVPVDACRADTSGMIRFISARAHLTFSIDSGVVFQSQPTFTGLGEGVYPIAVRDTVTGCMWHDFALIDRLNVSSKLVGEIMEDQSMVLHFDYTQAEYLDFIVSNGITDMAIEAIGLKDSLSESITTQRFPNPQHLQVEHWTYSISSDTVSLYDSLAIVLTTNGMMCGDTIIVRTQSDIPVSQVACGNQQPYQLDMNAPPLLLPTCKVITVAGFPILVETISGAGGTFSGSGKVPVPFGENVLSVTFTGVRINNKCQITSGQVVGTEATGGTVQVYESYNIGGEICVPPPPPPGYSGGGIDNVTGLDPYGFDSLGINQGTGTAFDRYGFNKDGYHANTGTMYNENGCSRDGVDEDGNACTIDPGLNPAAQMYAEDNEADIIMKVSSIISDLSMDLNDKVMDLTISCDSLRPPMRAIVNGSSDLDATAIFGQAEEYLLTGMHANFDSPPLELSGSNRSASAKELEDLHVDLYTCDKSLAAFNQALSKINSLAMGGTVRPDLLQFIFGKISGWTDYEYNLFTNDAAKFDNWIEIQVNNFDASGTGASVSSRQMIDKSKEDIERLFTFDPKPSIVDRVKSRKANTQEEADKILGAYARGDKNINGVDRIFYTRQLHEARYYSNASGSHNELPFRVTNSAGDKPYDIYIERIVFMPTSASIAASMLIEDQESGNVIVFRNDNIPITTGGLSSESTSRLTLQSTVDIRLNNASKLILNPNDTYISWNCSGFDHLGISADVEFCENYVKPVVNNEVVPGRVRLELLAQQVSAWDEFYLSLQANKSFVLADYESVVWSLNDIVLDFSSSESPTSPTLSQTLRPEWRGFFIGQLSATFGSDFITPDTSSSNTLTTISVSDAFIDDNGFTGKGAYTGQIISLSDGNIGGWAFSMDELYIEVEGNHLNGGGFGGQLRVPVMEDAMDYKAQIYPSNVYRLTVKPMINSQSDLFIGTIDLSSNSQVVVQKDASGILALADLTGSITFDNMQQQNRDQDLGDLGLPTLNFQNFQVSNQAPYFSPGIWSTSGDFSANKSFGGFGIRVDGIRPYQPDTTESIGIGLNIGVTLSDKLNVSAAGGIGIVGTLSNDGMGRQKWIYDRVEMRSLYIDADIKSFAHIQGAVEWENSPDAMWGKYFRGKVGIKVYALNNLGIESIGHFGNVNGDKYFYVDFLTDLPVPLPAGPIQFNGLGAGVYHNMDYVSPTQPTSNFCNSAPTIDVAFPLGQSLAGGSYTVDFSKSLGFNGIGQFSTINEEVLNGSVTIGMNFNDNSSLSKVYLNGSAQMLTDLDCNIQPETMTSQGVGVGSLTNAIGSISSLKPSSVNGSISAFVNLEYDLDNRTFDGELFGFLDAAGTGVQVNAVIPGKIRFSPDDWYIYLGTPTKAPDKYPGPISAELKALGILNLKGTAYFCIGTDVPPMAPLPASVSKIAYKVNDNSTLRTSGRGMVFGANVKAKAGIGAKGVVKADLSAETGFDVMLRHYDGVTCANTQKEIGINGWYASGQMYALLEGALKVFGARIFSAGVAAVLQAQLPNPLFAQATIGIRAKLLAITIRKSLKVSIGSPCEPVAASPADEFGLDVISAIDPVDQSPSVDPLLKGHAYFGMQVGKDYELEGLGGTLNAYRVELSDVLLQSVSDSSSIPMRYDLIDEGYALEISPYYSLPENEQMELRVTVDLYKNGVIVGSQSKSSTFTTSAALDYIPDANIEVAYPYNNMAHYHRSQYSQNFIQLDVGQPELFTDDNLRLVLVEASGTEHELSFSYDDRRLSYSIPPGLLQPETTYKVELVTSTFTQTKVLSSLSFTTSRFDRVADKVQNILNYRSASSGSSYTFESFSGIDEGFSDDDLRDLYSFDFSIAPSIEKPYKDQFYLTDLTCCYEARDIGLSFAPEDFLSVTKSSLSVNYEQQYYNLYKALKSEVLQCAGAQCFGGDCRLLRSLGRGERQLKSQSSCNFPDYMELPASTTGKINVVYKIPGSSHTDYHQIPVVKN